MSIHTYSNTLVCALLPILVSIIPNCPFWLQSDNLPADHHDTRRTDLSSIVPTAHDFVRLLIGRDRSSISSSQGLRDDYDPAARQKIRRCLAILRPRPIRQSSDARLAHRCMALDNRLALPGSLVHWCRAVVVPVLDLQLRPSYLRQLLAQED